MTDPTVVFKVKREVLGDHVHLRVFVGPDADHLALAGELVFREPEANAFEARLGRPGQPEAIAAWLRWLALAYRETIADVAGMADQSQALLFVHLSGAAASLLEVLANMIARRRW